MHVVSVVGASDAGKTTVVEALVDRLAERGSVGTIKHLTHDPDVDTDGKDTARHRAAGADETYGLVDDAHDALDVDGSDAGGGDATVASGGEWFATGRDLSLPDALDRLAPRHDYAVVEGYSGSSLPKVALGERDVADPLLERASGPDALDFDAVVDAIDDLEPHRTLESLVADVKASPRAERSGAIATFTGRVRAKEDPDDAPTEYLEFEKYDGVAEDRLRALREDLESRDGVLDVRLHHRTGVLEAGDDIVFVVVLAGHRREAFRAVEDGIDRLKEEVPLFKKEVTVDDEFWRHDHPDA
ncbi:molybdopterin synthase [Halorubellus sp. JP-L1]|uniref:molybdopterin synthase n=1 Tax=Halorubellus sp. JP-L1 TaxID=2715753 RepID=UPI0014074F62|nr:molybdopterin synthase [Halorubellus sp. JP-L1]NHN43241.1 molybdopterin synthase [Halorubellus sp. JP-L1]